MQKRALCATRDLAYSSLLWERRFAKVGCARVLGKIIIYLSVCLARDITLIWREPPPNLQSEESIRSAAPEIESSSCCEKPLKIYISLGGARYSKAQAADGNNGARSVARAAALIGWRKTSS
jgi:hypothetical protein